MKWPSKNHLGALVCPQKLPFFVLGQAQSFDGPLLIARPTLTTDVPALLSPLLSAHSFAYTHDLWGYFLSLAALSTASLFPDGE